MKKLVERLQKSFANHLDLVIVGASCPYQRGAHATDSHEARLFSELMRVIRLLKSLFSVPVHYFVENVAPSVNQTMHGSTPPYKQSPSSSMPNGSHGASVLVVPGAHGCVCRNRGRELGNLHPISSGLFPLCRDRAECWLEQNCKWNGPDDGWLPCLTQPQSRSKPPAEALGLAEASTAAVERWKEDDFRLPVAN